MYMPADVVTAPDLHQHIVDLLVGTITFGEFDEWLTGSTWEDSDVAPDVLPLVRSIQLALAEFSSGHRTWPNVRRYLAEMASWVQIQVTWGDVPLAADSAAFTIGSTSDSRVLTFPVPGEPPAAPPESPLARGSIQLEVVYESAGHR